MSKNLENEYKDYSEKEASKIDKDALWDRIEAALPEKQETSEQKDTNVTDFNEVKKKWYKNHKVVSIIGTVAAACVLAIILLANGSGLVKNKRMTSSDDSDRTASTKHESTMVEAEDNSYRYEEAETDAVEAEAEATSEALEEPENYPASDSVEKAETNGKEESGEVIYQIDFIITGVRGDYFSCLAISDNELMTEGTEFYLTYDYKLDEFDSEISMDLVIEAVVDGAYYFDYYK